MRSPGRGGDPRIEAGGRFDNHHRPGQRLRHDKRPIEPGRFRFEHAGFDRNAVRAQLVEAAAIHPGIRIRDGGDHAGDSRVE